MPDSIKKSQVLPANVLSLIGVGPRVFYKPFDRAAEFMRMSYTISRTLSSKTVSAIFSRLGSPLASDSAK